MKRFYAIIWLCSAVLVSCSAAGTKAVHERSKAASNGAEPRRVYAEAAFSAAEFSPTENSSAAGTEVPLANRKLIKTGSVRFTTADIQTIRNQIETLVTMQQGYIADESGHNTEYSTVYDMTVKIPSDSFDSFLHTLEAAVIKYDAKSVHIEDVSEEFIDNEVRVHIKKQTEARYAQLLAAAKDMKDILAIQKEMDNLRADIESLEGRLRYLSHEVQFSTLYISMHQEPHTGSSMFFEFKRFSEAFLAGISLLFELVLALISIWPFVIVSTLAVLIVMKKYRRKKWSKLPVPPPADLDQ